MGRVVHLRLHGSDRVTRFVIPSDLLWEEFLSGVQERLRLSHISRVEAISGETIVSIADLVDGDTIVVRAVSDDDLQASSTQLGLNQGRRLLEIRQQLHVQQPQLPRIRSTEMLRGKPMGDAASFAINQGHNELKQSVRANRIDRVRRAARLDPKL